MTTFSVHRVPCTRCAGTGELTDDRDPQSPRVRRCPDCDLGVSGWQIQEVVSDRPRRTDPLIGTLPATGTIDKDSAETFAACLECVPGREVEALEHFAQWEVYPDFLIEALGIALTGPSPLAAAVGGGGR